MRGTLNSERAHYDTGGGRTTFTFGRVQFTVGYEVSNPHVRCSELRRGARRYYVDVFDDDRKLAELEYVRGYNMVRQVDLGNMVRSPTTEFRHDDSGNTVMRIGDGTYTLRAENDLTVGYREPGGLVRDPEWVSDRTTSTFVMSGREVIAQFDGICGKLLRMRRPMIGTGEHLWVKHDDMWVHLRVCGNHIDAHVRITADELEHCLRKNGYRNYHIRRVLTHVLQCDPPHPS